MADLALPPDSSPTRRHPAPYLTVAPAARPRASRLAATAVAVLLAGGATHAQEDGPGEGEGDDDTPRFSEEITVTASREPRPVLETPGTVTVIDAGDIDRWLAHDVRDLTRYEPGVYVASDPTRFGGNGFNIRGIGGNRVLARIDGVPTSEQFDFGPLSAFQIAPALESLSGLEIVRSAGSALYGSDALGGVVSMRTHHPSSLLAGREFDAYFRFQSDADGRDSSWSGSGTTAFRNGRWQGLFQYGYRQFGELDNQGEVDTEDNTRTTPNEIDGKRQFGLAKLIYEMRAGNELRLTFDVTDSDAETRLFTSQGSLVGFGGSVTTVSDATVDDSQRRTRFIAEQVASDLGAGFADELTWRAYVQASDVEQRTREQRAGSRSTVIRAGSFDYEQIGFGGELQLSRRFDDAPVRRLTYGVELNRDRFAVVRDRADVDVASGAEVPGGLIFPTSYFPESEVTQLGVYVESEVRLGDRFSLFPGARFDYHDVSPDQDDEVFLDGNPGTDLPVGSSVSTVSPRLGFNLRVNDNLSLHGQYARGFRAPPYSDVNNGFTNALFGYRTLPNPDLDPETSDNYELGASISAERVQFKLSAFTNRYEDFIATESIGVNPSDGILEFQPRNVDDVRVNGVEVSGGVLLSRSWLTRFSYSYADGDNRTSDQPLNSVPPPQLHLGLLGRHPSDRWGGELHVTLAAAKDEDDVDRTVFEQTTAPSYQLVDLTAFYRLGNGLTLDFGAYNLFDETYWTWSSISGLAESDVIDRFTAPGRSVAARVRYEW